MPGQLRAAEMHSTATTTTTRCTIHRFTCGTIVTNGGGNGGDGCGGDVGGAGSSGGGDGGDGVCGNGGGVTTQVLWCPEGITPFGEQSRRCPPRKASLTQGVIHPGLGSEPDASGGQGRLLEVLQHMEGQATWHARVGGGGGGSVGLGCEPCSLSLSQIREHTR